MTRKERFNAIIGWFSENQPAVQSELHYRNPYELLVAVILSAQCTDKRVNIVTPPLFERFPSAQALASASFEEVFPFVKSVSYPNAKARHLIAMALDTHVFRVSHRLGLSDGSTPRAVELDLERHIEPALRPTAHHWLILHGRYVCTARRPKCEDCPLTAWCREYPLLARPGEPIGELP